MDEPVTYDELEAALNVIAAWLIAGYGRRLERVSLSLEGYYGPITECYGIVPITIGRETPSRRHAGMAGYAADQGDKGPR